ncbi:hypothetical protein GA830_19445 (plasmid) [Mesorhizobium sp. NBSH29]|nr:hypothetical protein GA830_19445 [Mesorhizobium sp. NBSH29]
MTECRSRCARSRSYPRNGLRDFLPLPAPPPFLARHESRFWPPSISFRPFGCGSIASGLSTAIEVAMGAARETKE